ncbi:WD40 repeat-like protein [Laetiporus sulphureus 93-53]|uniref:WD40 repeat-like protein n=1 Tax=Laetiporus sulphureus 93-53 TaxID=1314785 RepID=A0A165CVS3_9APHY|nr:WD40 repeat-like protein [Laetiporus sulphureus 93-53]KZT03524.1 WD40 repeat-like protein [Laetiporus sulphureus 93-53]
MINATSRINCTPSHPPPTQPLQNTIQLPMLGPLGPPPNRGPLQNQPPQQQQQQPLPQQQQGPQQSEIPPPPQSGQDFTLSNVLHFLQTEWRRYERDRNEWEIERAEMRARIALLEGERRSFDNVKLDLMRRIKMLEYALRVERSKQLAQPTSQAVPSAKLATLQAHLGQTSQKDDAYSHKEGSSGSSPRSEDSPLPPDRMSTSSVNGAAAGAPSSRTQNWIGSVSSIPNGTGPAALGTMGRPPPGRDPKSRARSRDYLKQCLQEVSYLTSPQAANPLPNRPLLNNTTLPLQMPNVPFEQLYNGRPRKLMPEVGKDFSILNGIGMATGPASAPAGPQSNPMERANLAGASLMGSQPGAPTPLSQQIQQQQSQTGQQSQMGQLSMQAGESKEKEADGEPQQLATAIFRPGEDWREKLRLSHEAAEQARGEQSGSTGVPISGAASWERRNRDEDDEGKEEEPDVEDEESSVIGEGEGAKVWKAKRTLRNHLDAVRALAFHPSELCLATGGDDNTVKIWRVDVTGLASSASRPTTEVEPQLTLRGHSAAITRLVHAPSKQLLYSASLDSSIRIWALPPASHTTYAPYDATRARGELVGHTDAVWDLALVRDESTLISCGAEGAVKVWDVSGPSGGGSLRLTWGYDGLEAQGETPSTGEAPGASAVEAIKTDLKKVAVAYQNAVVKIFDVENGKELMRLQTEPAEEGVVSAQANSIVSHPTMPLLITGHEDKHIRIFDILTGQCTHSMLAHLDGVTSLSIDAAGFSLVSGSHDCSVRFWDILGSKACVQEITSHREKAREGVLDVEFHPTLPIMASAGADGVVKLYASS